METCSICGAEIESSEAIYKKRTAEGKLFFPVCPDCDDESEAIPTAEDDIDEVASKAYDAGYEESIKQGVGCVGIIVLSGYALYSTIYYM